MAFVGGLEGYNLDALADVCHLADKNKEVRHGSSFSPRCGLEQPHLLSAENHGAPAFDPLHHLHISPPVSCSLLCAQAIISNFVRRFQSITTLTAYVTATDDAEWQSRVRTPGDTIATAQGGRFEACG